MFPDHNCAVCEMGACPHSGKNRVASLCWNDTNQSPDVPHAPEKGMNHCQEPTMKVYDLFACTRDVTIYEDYRIASEPFVTVLDRKIDCLEEEEWTSLVAHIINVRGDDPTHSLETISSWAIGRKVQALIDLGGTSPELICVVPSGERKSIFEIGEVLAAASNSIDQDEGKLKVVQSFNAQLIERAIHTFEIPVGDWVNGHPVSSYDEAEAAGATEPEEEVAHLLAPNELDGSAGCRTLYETTSAELVILAGAKLIHKAEVSKVFSIPSDPHSGDWVNIGLETDVGVNKFAMSFDSTLGAELISACMIHHLLVVALGAMILSKLEDLVEIALERKSDAVQANNIPETIELSREKFERDIAIVLGKQTLKANVGFLGEEVWEDLDDLGRLAIANALWLQFFE